jgi:hypothetical protein
MVVQFFKELKPLPVSASNGLLANNMSGPGL